VSNQQVWQNQTPAASAQGSIITRHWRGEYSAGKALLIACIAGFVASPVVLIAILGMGGSQLVASIPAAAIGIWGGVGAFRSGFRLRKAGTVMQRAISITAMIYGTLFVIGQIVGVAIAFSPAPAPHPPRYGHHVHQ